MPCDTRLKKGQTLTERKAEVRKVIDIISRGLATGRIKAVVATTGSAKGAIAFSGLTDQERDGVTDACAYRLTMVFGSALAKAKLAALPVNKATVAQGHHSHDGGLTFHPGHK